MTVATKHGLYSKYATGRVAEVLAEIDDPQATDFEEELRLMLAQVGAALEKLQDLDTEEALGWWRAIAEALNRIANLKQRQRQLEQTLSFEEFRAFLERQAVILRAYVPEEKWRECERDLHRLPVVLGRKPG